MKKHQKPAAKTPIRPPRAQPLQTNQPPRLAAGHAEVAGKEVEMKDAIQVIVMTLFAATFYSGLVFLSDYALHSKATIDQQAQDARDYEHRNIQRIIYKRQFLPRQWPVTVTSQVISSCSRIGGFTSKVRKARTQKQFRRGNCHRWEGTQ